VQDLKQEGLWTQGMLDELKFYDGELADIESIPEELKQKHLTVFGIGFNFILDAAARRQKWIDQSQSVNLFLASPDMKALSHMYRHAWHVGLKTTYYLRTMQASNIEKATVTRPKKELPREGEPEKKTPTPEEQNACSINAMMNGEECESCQ
jgi:ribonucleoside-diphosphate reductase alpha chain